MNKVTIDGQEFELVPYSSIGREEEQQTLYALKPIKKVNRKTFKLAFFLDGSVDNLVFEELALTPSTAEALAEAIRALVEFVTSKHPNYDFDSLTIKARDAYQGDEDV